MPPCLALNKNTAIGALVMSTQQVTYLFQVGIIFNILMYAKIVQIQIFMPMLFRILKILNGYIN